VAIRLSLPWRIGGLVAGTTLPLIAFATAVVYFNYIEQRDAAHDRVLAAVRSTRSVLDAETQRITTALQVLAQSDALRRGDLETFRRIANGYLREFDADTLLVLGDRDGRIVLDSRGNVEPGGAGPGARRAQHNKVFDTGRPEYSELFFGTLSKRLLLTISVPVMRDGVVVYDLSINPPLSLFQKLLESQTPGPAWTFSFFDQKGVNFARLPNPAETVGKPASPTLLAELFKAREAKLMTRSLENVPLLTAFTRSDVSGWTVAAGIDEKTLVAPLQRRLLITMLIGLALLSVGLAFAVRLGTRVARAEAVQALLVDELNHRMKNVLTMVQLLASQTFRAIPAAAEATRAFQQRIAALARASGLLRADRWQSAELREIVINIVNPLGPALAARVDAQGPSVALVPQSAMLVSMVLHELATNAVKYGALSNDGGRVDLRWQPIGAGGARKLQIVWSESGGPPVEASERKGFGTTLIQRGFADQSGGRADVEFLPSGVRCTLECALPAQDPG
jgi:two-component sensor histidine kinase